MSRLLDASVDNPLNPERLRATEDCDSPGSMHGYPHTCLARALVALLVEILAQVYDD